uniref:Uncharacterized protein n=1 Tax=Anguilla anguilla TaxID=7936 RepID=A0A0E9XS76_ANGAN
MLSCICTSHQLSPGNNLICSRRIARYSRYFHKSRQGPCTVHFHSNCMKRYIAKTDTKPRKQ